MSSTANDTGNGMEGKVKWEGKERIGGRGGGEKEREEESKELEGH